MRVISEEQKEETDDVAGAGDARDAGWIPGSGKSPGGGSVNPLEYSSLGDPVDREAWWATVYAVPMSQTPLSKDHLK